MYAAHFLPKMGYAKRAHLMNTMVPGLSGGKMSSSDPKSKIDFLDSPADIKSKLKAAVCTPGQVEGNGVLAFVKAVLIPVQELQEERARARGEKFAPRDGSALCFVKEGAPEGTLFTISRPEKFGGDIHFASYQALEDAYAKEDIHPGDLKGGVTDALIKLLGPIRAKFDANPEWQEAEKNGYPDASVQVAVASAKQGAGVKTEGKAVSQAIAILPCLELMGAEKGEGDPEQAADGGGTCGSEGKEGAGEACQGAGQAGR